MSKNDFIKKSNKEWMEILEAEQFMILREESTEPPNTSELNHEKRKGDYYCAGCDTKLFSSKTKYIIADLAGLLFTRAILMFLKPKQIIC